MKAKYEFTMSGMIIGLIVVGMMASGFGLFMVGLNQEYGTPNNTTFTQYDKITNLTQNIQEIRDSTDIGDKQPSWLDMVEGYFRSGYQAVKISFLSFDLFTGMMNQAGNDVSFFSTFIKPYLSAIIIIALLMGVVIAVLVKMRI